MNVKDIRIYIALDVLVVLSNCLLFFFTVFEDVAEAVKIMPCFLIAPIQV
jgi:hypothetical protein